MEDEFSNMELVPVNDLQVGQTYWISDPGLREHYNNEMRKYLITGTGLPLDLDTGLLNTKFPMEASGKISGKFDGFDSRTNHTAKFTDLKNVPGSKVRTGMGVMPENKYTTYGLKFYKPRTEELMQDSVSRQINPRAGRILSLNSFLGGGQKRSKRSSTRRMRSSTRRMRSSTRRKK
jgi:hypothetical protein